MSERITAPTTSSAVTGSRPPMMLVTEVPLANEVPSWPVSADPSQWMYRSKNGRFRCNRTRIACSCAFEADSPAIAVAASPGRGSSARR